MLSVEELQVLTAYAAPARWPSGFAVYQRGAAADGIFLVVQGCVVLRTRLRGGRAFVPRICAAGELFGAEGMAGASATGGAVYLTDARATTEALTLHLSRRRLRTLLRERPTTAFALLCQVGTAHGQLLERLRELSMLSVEQRLLEAVARARVLQPGDVSDRPVAFDPAAYRLLCEMVGATRESVSLVVNRLMKEGLARRDGERVVIGTPDGGWNARPTHPGRAAAGSGGHSATLTS